MVLCCKQSKLDKNHEQKFSIDFANEPDFFKLKQTIPLIINYKVILNPMNRPSCLIPNIQ